MKQIIFPGNISIDEKRISFIERIVSRLARRSRKVAKAMISPIPISSCVIGEDVSGTIMKALLFEGKVNRLVIQFNERPKNIIETDIVVGDYGNIHFLRNMKNVIDLDLNSCDGDILRISINSMDPEYKITEVLTSILWTPTKQDIEVKSFLIDKLEETVIDLLEE